MFIINNHKQSSSLKSEKNKTLFTLLNKTKLFVYILHAHNKILTPKNKFTKTVQIRYIYLSFKKVEIKFLTRKCKHTAQEI